MTKLRADIIAHLRIRQSKAIGIAMALDKRVVDVEKELLKMQQDGDIVHWAPHGWVLND